MKAQVIVTPLPIGNKLETAAAKNYEQLLAANNQNLPETKWWNHYLEPLESKYNLFYHSAKSVFQIYYRQGKNKAANKEINQIISNAVKKANTRWQEILKAVSSFDVYRNEKLKEPLDKIRQELTVLIKEQQKLDQNSEEYKALAAKQEALLNDYKQLPAVIAVNQEYDDYQKDLQEKIDNYLANESDFTTFVKTLEFQNPFKEKAE